MPRFDNKDTEMVVHNTGHFGFSGAKLDDLGSSEYTLVVIAADRSGSVSGFQKDMEAALKEITKACQSSPRADNLLLRYLTFDSGIDEVHGFKPLADCNVDDYDGSLQPGGKTALYDASVNAIESVSNYGKQLMDQDYDVNAIVFVITDGDNNNSAMTLPKVKTALSKAVTGETLESLVSILIGVNIKEPNISQLLRDFHSQAGFTQYEELANATKSNLAKLAQFVSKSISSQSQALGSGQASKQITF